MKSQKIVLKGVRSSYPHLFTKDQMSNKYTCDFLIEKTHPQFEELKAAAKAVYADAQQSNPGKIIETLKVKNAGEKDASLDGYYILKTKTSSDSIRSNVFQKDENGVLTKITDESEFYGGCNCDASIVVSWYEFQGKCGVHVLLNAVCRRPGGDPFGRPLDQSSDFAESNDDESFM